MKSSTGCHFNTTTRIVNDTRYVYCVKKQVLRLGWKKAFVKGEEKKKKKTLHARQLKKQRSQRGRGTPSIWAYSLHVRVAYIMSHGNTRLFLYRFFPPVSNNIIKNHTINWAMLTEEVVWQREGGFHLQEEGGSRDKKKCSQMITRFARVIPTSQTAPTAGCCCHAKPRPLQGVRVVQVLLCTLHHQARLSGNKLAGWNASSRLHLKETHWTDDVRGWVK